VGTLVQAKAENHATGTSDKRLTEPARDASEVVPLELERHMHPVSNEGAKSRKSVRPEKRAAAARGNAVPRMYGCVCVWWLKWWWWWW